MKARGALSELRVEAIWQLVVEHPSTLGPDASLAKLLEKVVEDTRTRHVYVVDENDRLLGSVRMQTVVEQLFPMEAIAETANERDLFPHLRVGVKTVRDIMNTKPAYVHRDTPLNQMARLLIREKISELPVVEKDRRLIGQVNMYEVITAYLRVRQG